MDKATTVDEILRIQQQIFNLQDQIDRLQGQIKYMDASSSTSLISVNLSTDELALPYAPDNAWRPQLVFKQAVRSLIGTLRTVGNASIWLAVYTIIFIPVLIVFFIVKKALKRRALKS
jgi:ABC-type glycerol-3-phosphate transport system permease component